MTKAMRQRDVRRALKVAGCEQLPNRGSQPHEKWQCPCGRHTANIPRHRETSAGVVADTIKRMECLPEGWLQ